MGDLYEDDILLWSERQADLLRRHAADQRANDLALDWSSIIEKIVSVGNEQPHAVESLLLRALIYRLKAEAWPESRDVPHWRAEERTFRYQARRRAAVARAGYLPSHAGRVARTGVVWCDAPASAEILLKPPPTTPTLSACQSSPAVKSLA